MKRLLAWRTYCEFEVCFGIGVCAVWEKDEKGSF